MRDQHSSLSPTLGKIKPVDYVVQPALKLNEQCLAGEAALLLSLSIVASELPLGHVVDAASFLLLPKLLPVLRHSASPPHGLTSMLARRVASSFKSTFRGIATLPLQEELLAFPAAYLAHGSTIFRHSLPCSLVLIH